MLIITALVTAPIGLHAQPEATRAFLRTVLGFSAADLREVAQGRAPIRSLDTVDGREIAIAGAVRVAVSPEQYVEAFRDIVEFKRHEAVQQIGVFGNTPQVSDLAGLTLDNDHISDLRDCRLHHCDLQLSRAAIERIAAVKWAAPDAAAQANAAMRELLTQLVVNYRRSGDEALMTYENERQPLSVTEEFRTMMAAPPAVLRRFPTLERHLRQFPTESGGDVTDVIYWSKEDVGPKVIISVTHLAIARVSYAPVIYAAASKQLYGSHYFDSSLGLTLLLQDDNPSTTTLVYLNRSRIDVLDGFLGGLKRAVVRSRARAAMSDTLSRLRVRLPARLKESK